MVIYLDTSALIKLYIKENGSKQVNNIITKQNDPLPLWDLHVIELKNALKLKVYRKELELSKVKYLISLFNDRKNQGIYYTPQLDRIKHIQLALKYSDYTIKFGNRSLDILHVAAAKLFSTELFVTFDTRQKKLAKKVGLKTILLS